MLSEITSDKHVFELGVLMNVIIILSDECRSDLQGVIQKCLNPQHLVRALLEYQFLSSLGKNMFE